MVLALLPSSHAAEADSASATVSFHQQIRPIFEANCQGCHQPAKAKGGYVMTEFAKLFVPGESSKQPVVHGKPDLSLLIQQITPENGEAEMPRGRPPLAETEIALIRRWITEGALDDTPPSTVQTYDADHPPVYSRPPVINSLDYSPDGTLLAVSGFHEVLLHHSNGDGIVARLVGLAERIQSVRFSPDGKYLAVAGGKPSRMGEVQVWDVASRELKVSVSIGHDTVYGANWSPDGRWVSFGCPDKTVRAIEASTGKQILQQMAHEDWVLDTVFSTNGTHVISVGRDMTTKLTEVPTQRFVDNITSITPGALRGGLQSIDRHPHRDEVLVGGSDGVPQIYQVFRQAARKIGDNAALLRKFPGLDGRIFGVEYSPDGSMIAACASLDGKGAVHLYASQFDPVIPDVLLKAYEKTSGQYTKEEREAIERFTTADVKLLHKTVWPSAPIYSVAFSPDGRRLAAGTGSGLVLGFDTDSGDLELVFTVIPSIEGSEGTAPAPVPAPSIASATAVPPPPGIASAPTTSMMPSAPAGTPLIEPAVLRATELRVEPATLRSANRNEQVQILVHALTPEGDLVDVTRQATYTLPPELGAVSARGRFIPNQPGRGTLRVTAAGVSTEVPVDLTSFLPLYRSDFVTDVNPVLSQLGCNAGTCHGAREGKMGFKLSLRGYDPLFDVRALTDDLAARRINLAAPDESLMLLKSTGVVPHEGGQRTTPDTHLYAILRQWIADGAQLNPKSPRVTGIQISPSNPTVQAIGARQQVRVVATFSDGATRDVTGYAFIETGNGDVASVGPGGLVQALRRGEAPILARYEGSYAATTLTVMGDRAGFVWTDPPVHNRIDELVAIKWKRMKILPSDLCTDAEFIRRVSLDLTGLPPSAAEVREFLSNPRDPRSKRDALVERLLNSQAFLDHWANKWADLLQVNRKFLGEEGARLFNDWIRKELASNTPYDEFVRKLITASGSNKDNPAAAYWKILRTPAETMENTTHLFLATRFNCNKCHDHPFERWTQDQYYQLAQYFAQVDFKKDEASGDRSIGGTAVEGAKPLFEIVTDSDKGDVPHDRTGKVVPASFPYQATVAASPATRREALAEWMTAPDNAYFALSYVNRLWGYLLGVGLIEPLDDIRAGNPPSNPPLLEHLTREFVESGFNFRHILRQICQSRTYQLSLVTHRWNEDDRVNFSHALPRRLPAEVLLDAVYHVTGSTPNFPGAQGVRAAQLLDSAVDVPGGFLANLGRPARESSCECERSNDMKLSSVMSLLSGPAVSEAVGDPSNALSRLVETESDDRKLADELFLRILGRPARESERALVATTTETLEKEHQRLTSNLAEAEAAWALRKPALEAARAQSVALAENALAGYLASRAASVAAAHRERQERIAVAEAVVQDLEPALASRVRTWESTLNSNHLATAWMPLDPQSVQGAGSAQLRKLPDGSIRSTASVGELPTYTVTAKTQVPGITGVKLEVLPDPELPNYGPGHKNGDFYLAEFVVDAAPATNANSFARQNITAGAADFIADGLQIEQTFNNVTEQGRREGWSIGPRTGSPHWAAFAFEKPVGDTNGTVLRFSLQHRYEAPHEVGRFRLWITTSPTPTEEGLPAGYADLLKVGAARRSAADQDKLAAHVRSRDPEFLKADFDLIGARAPIPADRKLAELEQDLARASRPIATDPALIQLRRDADLSARQLANKRLTAAQDLTWALINTPAFLFNR
ncbi:MAG: DUF1549 domain-containing protein [Limisphaerales bacterium]